MPKLLQYKVKKGIQKLREYEREREGGGRGRGRDSYVHVCKSVVMVSHCSCISQRTTGMLVLTFYLLETRSTVDC